MKKILLVLAVSLFAFNAFAQTEKGAFRVGGAADLSFINSKFDGDDDSTNNINLGVDAGYFVIDNLSINLGLGFGYTKIGDSNATAFGVNVGARYYLPVKVFFDAAFDLTYSKAKINDVSGDGLTGTGVTLMAGYAWFLNERIAIEPAIGYRLGLSNKDDGTKQNNFGVQIGFGLYF